MASVIVLSFLDRKIQAGIDLRVTNASKKKVIIAPLASEGRGWKYSRYSCFLLMFSFERELSLGE